MADKRNPPRSAWKPGQSGNPTGKKPGSRNKATMAVLALMETGAKRIAEVVIDAAKAGDLTAARIVLDKLVPVVKERTVTLPTMPSTESPAGVAEAQARARLAQRLEPHGLAVDESFRGDALIAAAEIFGLDPAPGNEPLDRAAGPDLHHNRSCHGNS